MIKTLSQAYRLIVRERRGRWLLLVALAALVTGVEMLGAVLVFVLLNLVVDPEADIEIPLIGDLRGLIGDVDDQTLVIGVVVTIGIFFLVRSIVTVGARYVEARVAFNAGARLANKLVDGYLAWPYAIHLRRNTAELIRNAHQATNELVSSMFLPMINMFAHTIVVIGMLAVLATIAPSGTALAALILGGAAFLLLLIVQPRLKRLGQVTHEMSRQTLAHLQEALQGVRDVKLLGRERFFSKRYATSRIEFARARYLRTAIRALPPVVMEMSLIAFILLLFGLTSLSASSSEGIISTLGLFAYAGMRLRPSLQMIITGFNSLKYTSAPLGDLDADLTAVQPFSTSTSSKPEALRFENSVVLENVSFRYDGADIDALIDIDLVIEKGEQIGICGPTGGGKSTLVDVITGLLPPTSGRVMVDGVDMSGSERSWQRNLGVVSQSIFLIDGTLRQNIALGQEPRNVDEDALTEAIELAQLSEMMESLPDGLDTTVGERGVRLSGGQRQRVAIARALYRRPEVLIFDEGTSALDNTTEFQLLDALDRLRGKKTMILVAHRLSSVKSCDRVLFIAGGAVSGSGTFEQLLEGHPQFRAMAASEG